MEPSHAVVVAAVAGLASGPWLRALVFTHSVAAGPPTRRRCPGCGVTVVRSGLPLAPLDGRCDACRARIGPSAGHVEIVAVVVLFAVSVHAPSWLVLFSWTGAALVGIAAVFVDMAVRRLPERLLLAAGGGGLVVLGVAAIATDGAGNLGWALAGAAGFGALALVPVLRRGDAVLAAVLALNVGWLGRAALVTMALATAALAVAYLLASSGDRRVRWADHVPMAPFLLLGALVAVVRSAPPP